MGTRADFYVGNGESAQWVGSIAWDGYVEGIDEDVLSANSLDSYLSALGRFFRKRDDVTLPKDGWPWPWETSHTTDCAYCFVDGKTEIYSWGCGPMTREQWENEDYEPPRAVFPEMSTGSVVLRGPRSGLIVFERQAGQE